MLTIKSLVVLALPLLAATNPLAARTDQTAGCNGGSMNCCNSVQTASSSASQRLFSLLGLTTVQGLVGFGCNPITAIGAGGNSCTTQAVCCTGNKFNGLVAFGCSPVNMNL